MQQAISPPRLSKSQKLISMVMEWTMKIFFTIATVIVLEGFEMFSTVVDQFLGTKPKRRSKRKFKRRYS
jgi:hypothetical protein